MSKPLRILITGGARGIGRGLFRHFLRGGHSVYILDSNATELEHVKTLADQWKKPSSQGIWKATLCDLRDRAAIKTTVEDVKKVFDSQLDVLIHNAMSTDGVGSSDAFMDYANEANMADWDAKIAIGLTAPYYLSSLCVYMLAAGHSTPESPGTIINISSTRAYQAEMNHEAYSAAKAGVLGLAQAMSVSLGHRHGIRVNSILPGWIHVETECKQADEDEKEWTDGLTGKDADWHPVGRVGKVDDVAKAVEYLVGNAFVTGQEVTVDGGVGRKMVYPE